MVFSSPSRSPLRFVSDKKSIGLLVENVEATSAAHPPFVYEAAMLLAYDVEHRERNDRDCSRGD
jgi:hypothetical protein